MDKIGFFGGSFNPPTIAHLRIVEIALKEFGLKKVVIVPMGDKYEKSELVSFDLRFKMLQELFVNHKNVEISKLQENQLNKSYAIDTFKQINELYTSSENFFIMGADNFSRIKTWKNADELIKNYKYIVFSRDKSDNRIKPENSCFINFSYDISSTQARKSIKENQPLEKYLNENLINFIKKNNLYK